MKKLFRYIIVACLCFHGSSLHAQDTLSSKWIDIGKIKYTESILKRAESAIIDNPANVNAVYTNVKFSDASKRMQSIAPKDVTRTALLRFKLFNSSDSSARVWFFPGFYYSSVALYRVAGNSLMELPVTIPKIRDNLGYRGIEIMAGDSMVIVAELRFLRTYLNTMRPRLIPENQIPTFISNLAADHDQSNMVTYLFCGLLLMMILFSIANYVQGANKEFVYYAGYALFLGGMLFTKSLFDFHPNATSHFFESYFDFIMQCIGHGFYMFFMQQFLATRTQHPFLYRLYNFGVLLLLTSMLAFSYFHYFTNNYSAELMVENATKILLLAMTIAFLVYGMRNWKDKLLRYLVWGNLCLFIFSLLSQASVMIEDRFLPGILGSAIFYYELGIFLELVFFLAALNHKNRRRIIGETRERERLKTENQLKEYEKEIAVYKAQQEERQRISADMHDELGAGMTAIRLMSEIARNKMKESTPVEIEKISSSADEVLNKMNAIIWSMNSGNDTLDNMVSYIRSYAIEYFENTNVDCKVSMPENIADTEVSGDKRRNIFLAVKETLNNVLKHAGATLVTIEFDINDALEISIQDNGAGIDMQKLRQFGNGLKNIGRRMESIGGSYTIENSNGTRTTLTLPL